MRIPLGNFDQPRATPQTSTQQAPGGQDPVGRAVERLGQTGAQVAENYIAEKNHETAIAQREAKKKADAMARAKAADAQLGYETQVKSAALDIQGQVERGEIPYQQAEQAYTDTINKIPPPQAHDLDPALQMHFDTGLKKTRVDGAFQVRAAAQTAQEADFKGQFGSVLDKLGKIAGMPGADIAKVNARADAYAPLAREAGIPQDKIDSTLQKFKDDNWTNQANQRITASQNDLVALGQIKQELSGKDGYYADKLDGNKRTALLAKVASRQQALVNRQSHAQDRANAAGARAIDQIDKQIASGIPATPDMWTQWADATKGTDSAKDFKTRVNEERQVQQVLQMPPGAQQEYIQRAQAKLQSQGGSVSELNNLKRLTTAVKANVKQLHDDPLLFNQAHMGDAIKPLDLEQISQPDAQQTVGAQFQHRAATIDAMRKQYGNSVPMKLLLPQEADALQNVLGQSTPMDQTKLFGLISHAVGDPKLYNAVMQQLAPKAPVLAFAGQLAERDKSQVVGTHWFSKDDTINSVTVASTMLEGQRILAGKGPHKSFTPPKDSDFRTKFSDATGDMFKGRPGAASVAMQAVRAYYVGKAAEDGDTSGELDTDRLSGAIRATLGQPADVNGNGNVLPPWGMAPDTFETAAQQAFEKLAKAQGLPQNTVDRWDDFGLRQRGDDSYYVISGNNFLAGKDGQPLVITVNPDGTP